MWGGLWDTAPGSETRCSGATCAGADPLQVIFAGNCSAVGTGKADDRGEYGAAEGCVAQRHCFGVPFSVGTPTVGTEAQLCQFCGSAWRHGDIPEPKQWPDPMGRGLSQDKASPSLPRASHPGAVPASTEQQPSFIAQGHLHPHVLGVCSYSTRGPDNPTQESFLSFSK